MRAEYRNLDKLRSSRAKRLARIRNRYGNPLRAAKVAEVWVEHWQEQDRLAALRFQREMEARRLAARMLKTDNLDELNDEQLDLIMEAAEEIVAERDEQG